MDCAIIAKSDFSHNVNLQVTDLQRSIVKSCELVKNLVNTVDADIKPIT